jgi:hypothetical protein
MVTLAGKAQRALPGGVFDFPWGSCYETSLQYGIRDPRGTAKSDVQYHVQLTRTTCTSLFFDPAAVNAWKRETTVRRTVLRIRSLFTCLFILKPSIGQPGVGDTNLSGSAALRRDRIARMLA